MERKTILITGGAGFIGSHLTDLLLSQNHRVLIIDDLSTGQESNISQHFGNPDFQFARASIMNEVVLDRLASEADIIVHLAAAVGVRLIVEQPVHTIETNIGGTEQVLKAALRYRCKVIIASTSEVYGKGSKIPFSEEDDVLLGATSKNRWAYAASKMVDEFLGLAYHGQYGLNVLIVRFFNTVGPRQTGRYGMVLPRFVKQALNNEPLTVYGDGTQSRCFCNVFDVIKGLTSLIEHEDAGGRTYNLGSTDEISIAELAQRVILKTNSKSTILNVPYENVYTADFEDMQRRVPDTGRLNSLVGWSPAISLDETIAQVVDYERKRQS